MTPAPIVVSAAIRSFAREVGASACGIARAEPVDARAQEVYRRWVEAGHHGSMQYCAKYADVRSDPRLLLEGARTVIVCAYSYYTPAPELPMTAHVARYAWGADYHYVLKERLLTLASRLTAAYGGVCRVVVDTAPMRERYWAQQAGVGMLGINNQLIVPGVGSYVLLGEVLWTGDAAPDAPCTDSCLGCRACVRACPGQALDGAGGCDARRCLSYLTIEHRGELPDDIALEGRLYGCDVCQKVCPHNAHPAPAQIPEFAPDHAILGLSTDDLLSMTPSDLRRLTRHSAMQRVNLAMLLRNLRHR